MDILVPSVISILIQRLSHLSLVTDLCIEQQIESEALRLVWSKIGKRDLKILCLKILEERTFRPKLFQAVHYQIIDSIIMQNILKNQIKCKF